MFAAKSKIIAAVCATSRYRAAVNTTERDPSKRFVLKVNSAAVQYQVQILFQ